MNINLRDLKQGDRIYSIMFGNCVLSINIDEDYPFPLEIRKNKDSPILGSFSIDGLYHPNCIYPSLFHSIEECIEYFESVKKEMDEESKPKKRYWIYSIRFKDLNWHKLFNYLDDNGFYTSGNAFMNKEDWKDLPKIKHENEFIDI